MMQNKWHRWDIVSHNIELDNTYSFRCLYEKIEWEIFTIELISITEPKHMLRITIEEAIAHRKAALPTNKTFLSSSLHITKQLEHATGAFYQVEDSDFINLLYEGSARTYDPEVFTHLVIITTTHLIEIAALNFSNESLKIEIIFLQEEAL